MEKNKMWTKKDEENLLKEASGTVEKAVKDFESIPKAKPTEFFDYAYQELTQELKEQKEYLEKVLSEKPQEEPELKEEKEEFRFP